MGMNRHQITYGIERVTELAKDLNLPKRKVIDVLLQYDDLVKFYHWKNADEFITAVENDEILLEDN